MRIELMKNGLIDDLSVVASAVRLTRSGDATYRLDIQGEVELQIDVWTTRKSHLLLRQNEQPPEWVSRVPESGEVVDGVEAINCLVHLECMDRRSYFLGLSRDRDSWGTILYSPAYAKARVILEKRDAR